MTETLDPVLPEDIAQAVERVLDAAHDQELMLATAESCTGGLLAALLTDVPGRSHVFERGLVVYASQAKCDLLAIERKRVDSCGAVSRQIAIDMAEGALKSSRADIALSITGYAGPPGKDEDGEEGLVHFGCARKNGVTLHREEHFGAIGRDGVRIAALRTALNLFEEALSQ
ncbi:CinA family protein [Croceibacterium sp. TMG7-5b_MA50]|uniref:CinA family protein n=1 Tax=Croceibacterium sp. TMG7-5b_MA50 TaxID=3121290 RepID=UPI00322172D5